MTTTGSIGRRLTLSLAAIAAILSVLSWSMVTSFARQAAERTQDNVLAASATTIAETLRSEGGEVRLELPYSAFSMLGAISEDRVFYRVAVRDETITGYADLTGGRVPDVPGQVIFDTVNYGGETLRMASITRAILAAQEPVPVTVAVAQTRQGIAIISSDLSQTAAALSVAFFVLAVALSAIAARTSLRPLTEIAQAVSRRGPSDLRPVDRNAPEELAPLLTSLNRLMDRLAQSFRRSEDFITEAAHRVRTPLATVRTQAEIALRSAKDPADRETLRRMIRAVDESSRSAGQLLDHATVAFRADDLTRDQINLAHLAHSVASALHATAEMKDIRLVLALQRTMAEGDPILLESALRNVLDNAIKYSPPDTEITVLVHEEDGKAVIEITDEGPGFGHDDPAGLTERFRRGGNVANIVGSGLGLTIVEEVLRAHQGEVRLSTTSERGGACVSLILPLA